ITEAEEVWLTTLDGRVVPAHPLAYDQESGFGLVQALGALNAPAVDFGDAAAATLRSLRPGAIAEPDRCLPPAAGPVRRLA
ncbi:S1C family serine protease, partial [Mesorhizobium sp. M1A.T.Ca.IN.004.03.1.1]|uniref:S1C family serine protease n=1 Tax=Mesorhizobium sp. M1A.T.Ca.IN.004.03.1.1 TaxID=2496795 RepID=UPI001FDFE12A